MKWIVLAIGLLCACAKTTAPQEGSQTHFLERCEDSCAAPFECVCGVCTLACSDDARCAGEHAEASCVAAGSLADECESGAQVCDVECDEKRDCSALGLDFGCDGGRCRSASVASGGSSGGAGRGQPAGGSTASSAGSGALNDVDGGTEPKAGRDASDPADAGIVAVACSESADCELVGQCGCGWCEPSKDAYRAFAKSWLRTGPQLCPVAAANVACGPCPNIAYEPVQAKPRAACIEGTCTVIDLREQPESACSSDDDCQLVRHGCCGSCGPQPQGWIALNTPTDPYAPACDPGLLCDPCGDEQRPKAICAEDGHCGVIEAPVVDGKPSDSCFSPWQNVSTATETTARGCNCSTESSGASICTDYPDGDDSVFLTCDGQWTVAKDGVSCN